MESIADFLGEPGTSLVLIVIVGAHILEEAFKGFRRFFNLEWFRTGREDFPVTKIKSLVIDQVGLFIGLTGLALLALQPGRFWPNLIWVAVGFIAADLIQHFVFSIVRQKYSPGVATSVLYLIFVLYFIRSTPAFGIANPWIPLVVGAAGLLSNYVLASRKVRKWRQRQNREPVPA